MLLKGKQHQPPGRRPLGFVRHAFISSPWGKTSAGRLKQHKFALKNCISYGSRRDHKINSRLYQYYSNKKSLLFDWSNQRLFNLYQPIIYRVGRKLTTIVLSMLFLFYKHDLTRTSLNICTENKNFPFWYEQLTYTTERIFSDSAVLRRKV